MTRRKSEMACSEAELRAMTADMVEMHHATFPKMRAALAVLGHNLRRRQSNTALLASRRKFVMTTGGLVVGSVFLTACGDDDDEATAPQDDPADTGTGTDEQSGGADIEALMLNASLENLAVFAYGAALEAAPKGMFGKNVPDAVAGFAQHAMEQHADHAEAFNAALTNLGGQPFTEPTPALAPTVMEMFAATDTVPKLAQLALTLENTAAATYVQQMGELTSQEGLSAVATIAPVERQHAAILLYVLGEYPVPDVFVPTEANDTSLGARTSADLTAA